MKKDNMNVSSGNFIQMALPQLQVSPQPNENVQKSEEDLCFAVFHNHLILQVVFKHIGFNDLCQARLVCRQWHRISLEQFRSQASITLYPSEEDTVQETKHYTTLHEFLDDRNRASCFPETDAEANYRFAGWPYLNFRFVYFSALLDFHKEVYQFWKPFGGNITSLQLISCSINSGDQYLDILFSNFTPNLKVFKNSRDPLSNSVVLPTEAYEGLYKPNLNLKTLSFIMCFPSVKWEPLLSCYPAITKLELVYPLKCRTWERNLIDLLLTIVSMRREGPHKLPIKILKIQKLDAEPEQESSETICRLLCDLKIPLQCLIIDTELCTKGIYFKAILTSYQTSLKRLKLCGGNSSSNVSLLQVPNLPTMHSLEELVLTVNVFRNMDFLLYVPKLKLLHMICAQTSQRHARHITRGFLSCSKKWNMPSVTNFRYDCDCSIVSLFKLMTWMPNVEELEMPLTNESFRLVCQHWQRLRKLTVQSNKLDDDGIVGVFRGDENTLNRQDFQQVLLGSYANQPYIRNLKYLHTFVMENRRFVIDEDDELSMVRPNDIQATTITEKSIYYGFLEMQHLRKVSITVDEDNVSKEAVQKLKNVVPIVNIVRLENPYSL